MGLDMTALATINSVLADLFRPLQADSLASLFAEYERDLAAMTDIAKALQRTDLIAHFVAANLDERWTPALDGLGRLDTAIEALDASYWQRALDLTDVLDAMPQARRDEWREQISKRKAPPFERTSVIRTLQAMLDQRATFFAERVDGIFQALSREHLTNRPEGFGKRMILARAYDGIGASYTTCGHIHDLRCVIAKLLGRSEPKHTLSTRAVEFCRRSMCGKWVELDGGALRMRVYKVGTAHLEVHEEVAWRLNAVLAHLHPGAIPAPHRERPRVREHRDYVLFDDPIPAEVIAVLADARIEREKVHLRTWREEKHALAAAEQVLEALGASPVRPGGVWTFDFPAETVLNLVIAAGKLPNREAYQFYPTPPDLAAELVRVADIQPGHRVLEPSAGLGAIASLLPENAVLVESAGLHCLALEAKFRDVRYADFLLWRDGLFDRIVMNPPFDGGRAIRHLEHAASMVAPGGRLVAVLPAGLQVDLGPEWSCSWMPERPFRGTSILVKVLVAQRYS